MALQTLTATTTGPVNTATSSSKGSTGNGTNAGFGDATPLIPAFLLAGVLTFGIFALLCFRRHRSGPFAPRGDAAIGPLGSGFYLTRGLGAARMSGGHGHGHGFAAAAARRREEREEVKLGDRPKIWDVLLDTSRDAKAGKVEEEEVVRWNTLQVSI